MAQNTKTFPCGHVGKGKFCQGCAQDEDQAQAALQARLDWHQRLASAPVPLDGLPKPIAEKAIQINGDSAEEWEAIHGVQRSGFWRWESAM